MNERMKELILEAGFPKFDKMYVVSDGEELEKFAQLIMQECIKISQVGSITKGKLKQHFGFKE